ncbi:malate/lactate/ureidoglycolate dehydrogenase [Elioraea rosea]|uniref:malate/lactate/ureidoglycolate dehydrogenase n=1 Tax=Elioraea rosea TaxID=2492390 RepID=UPI001181ECC1|nr:malate/lactate/ureidoglycolate dehydrogenase [Elioraea rosea]
MTTVAAEELDGLLRCLFQAAGSEPAEASCVAAHLVEANLVGHDSHGAIRAPKYVAWVKAGELLPNRHATRVVDAGPLVVVDGGFGYGQVIGAEGMEIATESVRQHGLCLLGIRNSGHLGRIGAWAEALALSGIVSVHFVNTSGYGILVAPHGSAERRLSANPIAAGAPGPNGPLVLDIATSATAEGKIQVARNKGDTLPPGLIIDGAGNDITDPAAFYRDPPGAILPFGGHKGSGLSVFCEILAGSLTGGNASHPENATAWRLVNNMLTLAVDPARLGTTEAFAADVARLVEWVGSARPKQAGTRPLLPGDIERETRGARSRDGIPLDRETCLQLAEAASSLGVSIPHFAQRACRDAQ